jgi:hypothetical protein
MPVRYEVQPTSPIVALLFSSSDAIGEITYSQILDPRSLSELRTVSRALLSRYLNSSESIRAMYSMDKAKLFQEWVCLIDTLEIGQTGKDVILQWISDSWICSDIVSRMKYCVKIMLRTREETVYEILDPSQLKVLEELAKVRLELKDWHQLEWQEVCAAISFSEWDEGMAKQLGWSKEEFSFIISENFERISEERHFLFVLRNLSAQYGRDVILGLYGAACRAITSEELAKVV